ncbi:phosphoglycerate mutase-like protein [Thelephora ganbajun]|uniref:Phosphoglycerate mutase-like protein n=1 Tax=Thelephora ganbajun TaxID=370292 RepID=A0ACB6Z8G7_THEGA|nr:phosphoglycerate mutase-like protein [Thelephora ganbajun]
MSAVKGVVVIARNGDRLECYQDPKTYKYGPTESTPFGESQSHKLGTLLRDIYLTGGSDSKIPRISTELVNLKQVHVRVKTGSEGTAVFDSATALLQGLFPPNTKNREQLADGSVVVAPLGGYQYIPVETVEPYNDLSLESWTSCPSFEKHIARVYSSDEFKRKADETRHFLTKLKDFTFGRPTTLENIWNVYDYVNTQLTHNKTYAYRLPPTYVNQVRDLVNWHEDKIFSDSDMNGIGNIAGRTTMHSVLTALERISFDGDPLQVLLIETTYQPMISFFHMTEIAKNYPQLKGLPDYASAIAIEIRAGPAPDQRDFVRVKFRNGTNTDDFETLSVFGHRGDIPLTEFIYRLENSVIDSPYDWGKVCGNNKYGMIEEPATTPEMGIKTIGAELARPSFDLLFGFMLAVIMLFSVYTIGAFIKTRIQARKRIQLPVTAQEVQEGSDLLPTQPHKIVVADYKSVAGRRY